MPRRKKHKITALPVTGRPKGPAKVPIYVRVLAGTKRTIDAECFAEDKARGEVIDRWAEKP